MSITCQGCGEPSPINVPPGEHTAWLRKHLACRRRTAFETFEICPNVRQPIKNLKDSAAMYPLEERPFMGKSTRAKESENVLFENLVPLDALLKRLGGKFARKTVYKWTAYSDIPHRKIRGRLFFDPVEVAEWLERTS